MSSFFFVAVETLIVEYPSLIQLVIITYMRLYKYLAAFIPTLKDGDFPPKKLKLKSDLTLIFSLVSMKKTELRLSTGIIL